MPPWTDGQLRPQEGRRFPRARLNAERGAEVATEAGEDWGWGLHLPAPHTWREGEGSLHGLHGWSHMQAHPRAPGKGLRAVPPAD